MTMILDFRRSLAAAILAGSALVSHNAMAGERFTLEDYFRGKTVAEGSFKAINGVSRTFTVLLTGTVKSTAKGKRLTLREDFVYSDGERERKTWVFDKTGPGLYTGTREDVIGSTEVRIVGTVAKFTYLVDIDPGPKRQIVRFHDRMEVKPDGKLENRALVTKFGFPVAITRVDFSRP